MSRAGLYAWGGPGTIRLLKKKYHAPRINETSFMRLYDPDYLAAARHTLGVTDMWITYSWGFADATEQPDRAFAVQRLPHFRAQQIAVYAYVQGLNIVTSEFAGQDIFCCDSQGRLLPYSKGRSLTCPNKPAARQIILDRVLAACRENFTGIYVDNILFGLPPFYVRRDYVSFFGCACADCQRTFHRQFGYDLPVDNLTSETLNDYVTFRCQSTFDLLQELSDAARAAGKLFGINLYDPYWMSPELYYGYRMEQIAPLLDYYMIENHALGYNDTIHNAHLEPLIRSELHKPTFVVSYRKGIGYDAAFGQQEIDTIWSEAATLGYAPCLKATEYITDGTWHALDITTLAQPTLASLHLSPNGVNGLVDLKSSRFAERQIVRITSRHYARLAEMSFENKLVADWITRSEIMVAAFRKPRRYKVECF